jgi:LacI family transcriptional regulator
LSKSTVSKALNGRSDVSEKTLKKVRSFAEKLNYTPNRLAQALKMKKSNLIGVVMHEMRHDFFVDIAHSITKEARQNGYQAIFASSDGSAKNEVAIIGDLVSRYIDGLIIIPCLGENAFHLHELAKEDYPCVIVDNYIEGLDIPFVGTDFKEGGYLATRLLLENGHRNIAFILGQQKLSSTPERIAGYQHALQEENIPLKEEHVKYGSYTAESGYAHAKALLRESPEITAILCANTDLSEGVSKAITESGREIPRDISLMDFGGVYFSAVDQQNEKIGQMATQMLLKQINGEEVARKTLISPTMINRKSVLSMFQGRAGRILPTSLTTCI